MTDVLEKLAALEHEQWSHWMLHLDSKRYRYFEPQPAFHEDDWVNWMRKARTPYGKLTDKEKESDRVWARKAMKVCGVK